jgi:hypothetical protein
MTIDEHATSFAGLPIQDYTTGTALTKDTAWRVRVDFEPEVPWGDLFESFLDESGARSVRALVVGNWGEVSTGDSSAEVVEALVAARERLPDLEAIFFGDIVMEESEISWIQQSDLSPIFSAYPRLVHFRVRGGNQLSLGTLKLAALRTLVVESGGLDASIVRQVAAADLPKLEHLELWLGTDEYGATWQMEDLRPILDGKTFPALKTLALRDSQVADGVALELVKSPILERIAVLDLSLGALSDEGGNALYACPAVKRLARLDLHRSYLSAAVASKLGTLGIGVDVSDQQEETVFNDGSKHRFVSVGE